MPNITNLNLTCIPAQERARYLVAGDSRRSHFTKVMAGAVRDRPKSVVPHFGSHIPAPAESPKPQNAKGNRDCAVTPGCPFGQSRSGGACFSMPRLPSASMPLGGDWAGVVLRGTNASLHRRRQGEEGVVHVARSPWAAAAPPCATISTIVGPLPANPGPTQSDSGELPSSSGVHPALTSHHQPLTSLPGTPIKLTRSPEASIRRLSVSLPVDAAVTESLVNGHPDTSLLPALGGCRLAWIVGTPAKHGALIPSRTADPLRAHAVPRRHEETASHASTKLHLGCTQQRWSGVESRRVEVVEPGFRHWLTDAAVAGIMVALHGPESRDTGCDAHVPRRPHGEPQRVVGLLPMAGTALLVGFLSGNVNAQVRLVALVSIRYTHPQHTTCP
ncbi:hypothetical protein PCL_11395 [Purpureocillium lilacinum]|uniref:Uncharacterized protein n=1 Tax=Purpureocillium lilacinum TaxID=33203 RepID=A0A2U3E9Y0_PURLI|nr:hypothetical protein PCL_11395 [Purpureocillium lilacinum]